jgi:hypothetical protein
MYCAALSVIIFIAAVAWPPNGGITFLLLVAFRPPAFQEGCEQQSIRVLDRRRNPIGGAVVAATLRLYAYISHLQSTQPGLPDGFRGGGA